MLSKVTSGAVTGVEGYRVIVEVDVSAGLPSFDIVGLPDSSVKESKDRVRLAIKNSGFEFPVKRLTVNLAPADTKKEGPAFDLPIAVGILACMGMIPQNRLSHTYFSGELSLDGEIKPVKGTLPIVHNLFGEGVRHFIVSRENAQEASLVEGAQIAGLCNLRELVAYLSGNEQLKPPPIPSPVPAASPRPENEPDFADVRGQQAVKRALEIAAAGGHNILMIGPPGSGKTMMAKRLPPVMPDLSFEESIEVTKIYSVSGLINNKNALIAKRPFRSPHHTISGNALTGGGRFPKPGEISLAHKGVLFLDELPEFNKNVLEVLRQPLEDKKITVSRVAGTVTYPSDFMLVASMNPCPCGNLFNGDKCICKPGEITRYLSKISGPLLDRIDIQVETTAIEYQELHGETPRGESSATIKDRIIRVRQLQNARYREHGIQYNAQLTAPLVEKYCPLSKEGHNMLKTAFDAMGMSVRGYHKILKVSRTIADMAGASAITLEHLAEAIQYRSLDRKYWK